MVFFEDVVRGVTNPTTVAGTMLGGPLGGVAGSFIGGRGERKAENAQQAAQQAFIDDQQARISGGMSEGRKRAEELYGQDFKATGEDVKDIVRRRREAVDKLGPQSSRLRESRNRQLRMAKASGASQDQLAQIRRQAESGIADTEYGQYQQNLQNYQSLVGNILRGQTGMELGYGQLRGSSAMPMPPTQSGGGLLGGLGTVICSELYRRGYMSEEIYSKDQKYGRRMIVENPDVYFGYRFLADPVVRLMQKSDLFAWMVSIPAMCWARNMAGDHNITGKLISHFGEKLCGFVGRMIHGKIQGSQIKEA